MYVYLYMQLMHIFGFDVSIYLFVYIMYLHIFMFPVIHSRAYLIQ